MSRQCANSSSPPTHSCAKDRNGRKQGQYKTLDEHGYWPGALAPGQDAQSACAGGRLFWPSVRQALRRHFLITLLVWAGDIGTLFMTGGSRHLPGAVWDRCTGAARGAHRPPATCRAVSAPGRPPKAWRRFGQGAMPALAPLLRPPCGTFIVGAVCSEGGSDDSGSRP